MADTYTDLFLHPNGTVGWHRFDLPRMHVRAFDGSIYLWRDHDTDIVWVSSVSGIAACGGRAQGNYPAAFDESGAVWVQHDASGTLTGYDLSGTVVGQRPAPYAAEGIAEVHSGRHSGSVVMMNDPSRIRQIPNGETWLNVVETAHYLVGQFGNDAAGYGGSISYYDKRTGQVRRWLGYTPLPIFAREDASSTLFVAISGNNAPAPDQVVWATHFPGETPPVEPPVEPPVDPPPTLPPADIYLSLKAGQTLVVKGIA